jgi:hypothetical protein
MSAKMLLHTLINMVQNEDSVAGLMSGMQLALEQPEIAKTLLVEFLYEGSVERPPSIPVEMMKELLSLPEEGIQNGHN